MQTTRTNIDQALVIVHLSSLDNYTVEFGREQGQIMADEIYGALEQHAGPIVIIDQNWTLQGSNSRPRRSVYDGIQQLPDEQLITIQHDENETDWADLFDRLIPLLGRLGVKTVRIGGFWYDPEEKTGCAWYVGQQLMDKFEVIYDSDILASFEDEDEDEEEQGVVQKNPNPGPQLDLDLEEPPTPPVTLYHGTTRRAARKIKQVGMLIPMIGSFVEEAYGSEYAEFSEEEVEQELGGVVFAAGFENLDSAITAMISHIASDRGKYFHDVTKQDIEKYGALVLFEIEDPDGDIVEGAGQYGSPVDTWVHRPEDDENYYGQYPSSVEPGDYFVKCDSFDGVGFDEILTGKKLVQFLAGASFWYMEQVS